MLEDGLRVVLLVHILYMTIFVRLGRYFIL